MPVKRNKPSLRTQVASLFSSAVYRDLASAHPSLALERMREVRGDDSAMDALPLSLLLDKAYQVLVNEYRNEYVFKNSIVSKIVFGRHRPTSAAALLELPLGSSFADVTVFNGTSTVYEIKTDLDSFARLESQIEDYSSRAEYVNLVVSEERSDAALRRIPAHVGLLALRRSGAISTVRAPQSNLDRLEQGHLFDILRQAEVESILRASNMAPDATDPADRWHQLRDLFERLDVGTAHRGTVRILRKRAMHANAVATDPRLPHSARALAYSVELSRTAQRRLVQRLEKPLLTP